MSNEVKGTPKGDPVEPKAAVAASTPPAAPTPDVFERWRKLYTMEHDQGATENEKATAARLREGLEGKYVGLANRALTYEAEYRAHASARKAESQTAEEAYTKATRQKEKTAAHREWEDLFKVNLEISTPTHVPNPTPSRVKEGLAQWADSTWEDKIGGPTRIDRGGNWENPVVGVHPFHRDRGGNFGGSGFGGL